MESKFKEIQEIAIKYGVPMPETCKKLEWKHDTIFFWFVTDQGSKIIMKGDSLLYELGENDKNIIPAPMMHNIAPLLSEDIDSKFSKKFIKNYIKTNELDKFHVLANNNFLELAILRDSLSYFFECYEESFTPIYVSVENHHYAESYAQLYLILKSYSLI